MNTFDAIYSRKSVRSYTGEAIDDATLKEIIKAGVAAPVGMGRYGEMHLTVISDKDLLKKISQAAATMMGKPDMDPLYGAPTLVLVSAKKPAPAIANAVQSSAACIVENMSLAAVDLGVGTVHIWGAVAALARNEELVASLGLPEDFTPLCGIALGKTDIKYTVKDVDMNRIATDYIG